MKRIIDLIGIERATGLVLVLALHAAVLWGLWQHRLLPTPDDVATLFVNFIAPLPSEKKEEPRHPPPPKPKPIEKPQPHPKLVPLVAETPVVASTDHVAPPPPQPAPAPAPVITAPTALPAPTTPVMPVMPVMPVAPPKPAGPVSLTEELSVACPERTPPRYPPLSRRISEEGIAVLRVELDEQGQVTAARVSGSSGFARLDEAALAAVRTWRCNPAMRDGRPVRAVALQPFKFVLQGN